MKANEANKKIGIHPWRSSLALQHIEHIASYRDSANLMAKQMEALAGGFWDAVRYFDKLGESMSESELLDLAARNRELELEVTDWVQRSDRNSEAFKQKLESVQKELCNARIMLDTNKSLELKLRGELKSTKAKLRKAKSKLKILKVWGVKQIGK